jgi:hypothetical protein
MTAHPYRARVRHALESVSHNGKTVTIEAALSVLIPLIAEFVREAVTDAYAEKSSD